MLWLPGVSIAVDSGDAHAVLTVEDNGPGITEDDLARAFELFITIKQAGRGDWARPLDVS